MPSQAKPTLSKTRGAGKPPAPGEPAAEAAPEGPAIDQVLVNLERVVAELEAGDLPLETALLRFEEGVRLARRGSALLDAVEQRVEVLLEGRDQPVPFAGAATAEDEDEDDEEDAEL